MQKGMIGPVDQALLADLFAARLELADASLPDPAALPSHGGVYLLTDQQDRPIQLAACQNLRRSVGVRLGRPEPGSSRANLLEITRRIWWQGGFSRFETTLRYYRIARRLYPRRYRELLGFGPCWFLQVDPTERLPRFVSTQHVYRRPLPTRYLGPFATRNDSASFAQILEDLFDLCRKYEILERVPHGQRCAYFEMGRCPAACDGSISLEQYRQMVSQAVAFAGRQRAEFMQGLQEAMARAAAELDFERAAAARDRLERARRADAQPFRFVADAERFCWLIVQRAGGTSWVKAFLVRQGAIDETEPVRLRALDEAAGQWIAKLAAEPTVPPEPSVRAEQTWLVGHFLFKQDRSGGLYLHADQLGEPCELAELVRAHFAGRKPAKHQLQPPGRRA